MMDKVELPSKTHILSGLAEQTTQVNIPLVFENLGYITHEMAKVIQQIYKIDSPSILKLDPGKRIAEQVGVNTATIDCLGLKLTWSHNVCVIGIEGEFYLVPR